MNGRQNDSAPNGQLMYTVIGETKRPSLMPILVILIKTIVDIFRDHNKPNAFIRSLGQCVK
jgi:hypothetical protein